MHNGSKKIKEFKMTLYFVKYEQMKKLLASAGFKKTEAYSDFSEKKFSHETAVREIVWVAQK
jgi:hypothetical protein